MPCGCLFDMMKDTLFDMILFEMIVISESSFEMTFVSKSRKSLKRLSVRDDAGLSLRYDGAIFFTPAACSGCPLFDTTKPRACNLYQTPYSRLNRSYAPPDFLFDMMRRTLISV